MRYMATLFVAALAALGATPATEPEATFVYDVKAVKRQLFLLSGETEQPVEAGAQAHSGDSLRTGSRSTADLEVADRLARFHLGAKTRFHLAHDRPGVLIDVERGSIRAVFGKLPEGDERDRLVTTPSAVLAVRGTEYGVEVEKSGTTTVIVFDGVVEVQDRGGIGETVQVRAGEKTRIKHGRLPSQPKAHRLSTADWDRGRRSDRPFGFAGARAPGTGSGTQQGGSGSRSQSSQGGSKHHGG